MEKKTAPLTIRVGPGEKEVWQQAANRAALTLSSWCRLTLLAAAGDATDPGGGAVLEEGSGFTGSVLSCARCGQTHPKVQFLPLCNPTEGQTHYANCPFRGQPIFASRESAPLAQEQASG